MKSFLLTLTLSAAAAASSIPSNQPVASTASGTLQGILDGSTAVFKGIPYAAAPTANLRWREPQPATAWTGIRDATKFGSPCTQSVYGTDSFLAPQAAAYNAAFEKQPVPSSEDCLYLNVWVPSWSSQKSLPVMVWLHGGSNVVGSGSESAYDGRALAALGVVVVTVNYRLGVMGFFTHPALTAESPHHSSGNYGLLDQMAALAWVKQNIAQFGGNPGNVTVFGESAGAVDIGGLIASPLSKGLFHRVISESGPAFGTGLQATLAQREVVGAAVGRAAQSATKASSALAALREMPATQVVDLTNRVLKANFPGVDTGSSVVDGWVLPLKPAAAYATGAIRHVDLMIGLNAREFSAFRVSAAAAAKETGPQKGGGFGETLKGMVNVAYPLYGNWTDTAIGTYLSQAVVHRDLAIDQATNDMLAACPIGATATLVRGQGQKVYVYKFERTVPGPGESNLGAFHSLELGYVFGAFHDREWKWLNFTQTDLELSKAIQTYWTNFAKTGNPDAPSLPDWKMWNDSKESYMEFSREGKPVPSESFSPRFCNLSLDRLRQRLSN